MQHTGTLDVARIVPSVRDLTAALAMRRRALVLVPRLDTADPVAALDDLRRLRDDVRAFAVPTGCPDAETLARASEAIPVMTMAACDDLRHCQRDRFHGADGVCLDVCSDWPALSLVARSMRMMPLIRVGEGTSPREIVERGASALVLSGALDAMREAARDLDRRIVVVADGSEERIGPRELGLLSGVVDAVVVGADVHRQPGFLELVDEFDP